MKIVFSVTNNLVYDQRMQRICSTLASQKNEVVLIGSAFYNAPALQKTNFKQKRLFCLTKKGPLFYAEYNIRLLLYLLFINTEAYVAIDLDTILPNYFASIIRRKKRVYDAHELFTELKEIVTRPKIQKLWLGIEAFALPKFPKGYTVNHFLAKTFLEKYGVKYAVIRNMPLLKNVPNSMVKKENVLLYQGAVNEGRSFETLIPAMQLIDATLVICGTGNFMPQLQKLIVENKVAHKVVLKGMVTPDVLAQITPTAKIGLTLFEPTGLNQTYSLANRFFDYMMAGIPQICVNYPEYAAINTSHNIAYLINDTSPSSIANAVNKLLIDNVLYNEMVNNCQLARTQLCWENEQKNLIEFYKAL